MNVYIVCRGERGEGHSPVAVFTTLTGVKLHWVERTYGPLTEEPGWLGYWVWSMANGVDQVALSRQRVQRGMP